MTKEQKDRIEARLTTWSRESEKAEDRWSKYLEEGNQRKADSARRRMIGLDGKIDAALEIIGIMGYTVIWKNGTGRSYAVIVEGK